MSTTTFADLGLSPDLLEAIERAGYLTPTPVQIETIPAMLAGGDVVIQSQTGTGKTAAFVLPVLEQMTPNPGVVEALVLSPTRELAQQIATEVQRLGAARNISPAAIYGGTSFQKQYDALETAQFVIATPGRLLDLMRRGRISFSQVKYFGLDEADELLSMGFEKDVTDVISRLPGKVRSFICSATFSETIRRVADTFISDPTLVNCSSDRIGAQSVQHVLIDTEPGARMEVLRRLVVAEQIEGAVIFCNTKVATFRAFEDLQREGLRADLLNGDLSQAEREKALERMRAGEVDFLVATDVAARGIDISGLPAVINFDMPETPEVYVHRTGRTGRAGQAGTAYSLLTPGDITVLHALEKFFRLQFIRRQSPPRDLLLTLRADALLRSALAGLDDGETLDYAQLIPAARRLVETPDGIRTIAKLAAFHQSVRAGLTPAVAPQTQPEAEAEEVDVAGDEPMVRPEREPVSEPPPEPAYASREPAESETPAPTEPSESETPAPTESCESETRRRSRRRGARRRTESDADGTAEAQGTPDPANDGADASPDAPAEPGPIHGNDATEADEADDDADNPVLNYFLENQSPRTAGRFSGPDRIGKATGLPFEEIQRWAALVPDQLEAGKKEGFWRLRPSARSEAPAPRKTEAAESEPPAEQETSPPGEEVIVPPPRKRPARRREATTKDDATPKKDAGKSRSKAGGSKKDAAAKSSASGGKDAAADSRVADATPSRSRSRKRETGRSGRGQHPASRRVFDDPKVVEPSASGPVRAAHTTPADPATMRFGTLRINVGPKDVTDAEALAEQIAEISGFDRIDDFGAARFDGKHAILEVRPDYIQDVQQAIARQKLGSISLDARILHRGETE